MEEADHRDYKILASFSVTRGGGAFCCLSTVKKPLNYTLLPWCCSVQFAWDYITMDQIHRNSEPKMSPSALKLCLAILARVPKAIHLLHLNGWSKPHYLHRVVIDTWGNVGGDCLQSWSFSTSPIDNSWCPQSLPSHSMVTLTFTSTTRRSSFEMGSSFFSGGFFSRKVVSSTKILPL